MLVNLQVFVCEVMFCYDMTCIEYVVKLTTVQVLGKLPYDKGLNCFIPFI